MGINPLEYKNNFDEHFKNVYKRDLTLNKCENSDICDIINHIIDNLMQKYILKSKQNNQLFLNFNLVRDIFNTLAFSMKTVYYLLNKNKNIIVVTPVTRAYPVIDLNNINLKDIDDNILKSFYLDIRDHMILFYSSLFDNDSRIISPQMYIDSLFELRKLYIEQSEKASRDLELINSVKTYILKNKETFPDLNKYQNLFLNCKIENEQVGSVIFFNNQVFNKFFMVLRRECTIDVKNTYFQELLNLSLNFIFKSFSVSKSKQKEDTTYIDFLLYLENNNFIKPGSFIPSFLANNTNTDIFEYTNFKRWKPISKP